MIILLIILLSAVAIVLLATAYMRMKNEVREAERQKEQEALALALQVKEEFEKREEEGRLRELFAEEEALRLLKQESDKANYLESVNILPSDDFLKYQGCRMSRPLAANGNGFEFIHVSDEESVDRPGVYGIYAGDVLLYVGKANGPIKTRFREHAKSAKYITEGGAQQDFLYQAMRDHKEIIDGRVLAHVFMDDPKEIAKMEKQLIQELNPICNIVRGGS